MSLGLELRSVLNKHIDNNSSVPDELKPLMKEATIPIINSVCSVLGNMELACRRTLSHSEIWDKVGK